MNRFVYLPIAAMLSTTALAAPETFVIDHNHTLPRFSYNHMGFSTQLSRFDKVNGKIVYDPEAHTGSVDVTIDMTSVDTGSTSFTEHLKGPDFFDTAKYPTATFKSTIVKFVNGVPASVEGNLTIKGITRPVTLTVTSFKHEMNPIFKKDEIGANATTTIKRSDFGAGKYVPLVGDEVTLTIPVEAFKE